MNEELKTEYENCDYFNDSLLAYSQRRLKAIIYENYDSVELGAGGIQFEYVNAEGKSVITPVRCSLGDSYVKETFILGRGEYIKKVEKNFFQTPNSILLELTIYTNQDRYVQIGYHNRYAIVRSESLDVPQGYEIFAFRGCYDEKNLLDVEISLKKKTNEYLFNDMPFVQGNGPLKKIHVYQDDTTRWINGIQMEYEDTDNNISRNPMNGIKGGKRSIIDLTHYFKSSDQIKEIYLQYVKKASKIYISMIKVTTNRRMVRSVGKREKTCAYEVTLSASKGCQIYALRGSCCADDFGRLASLEVSMYASDQISSSIESTHQAQLNEKNEIFTALNSKWYTANELSQMYQETIQAADTVTKEQLQRPEVKDHILGYKLTNYILQKKQIVFRGIYPRELKHFTEEKKTYSKAQNRQDLNYRPKITQDEQNKSQKSYATTFRIAAVGDSSKPVSQFTSNAFEVGGYVKTYATGEKGLLYAYETVPNSQFFGIESKEYQCQILGGTSVSALYCFEINGDMIWKEYDYKNKKWKQALKRPINKDFQAFINPGTKPGGDHPELANESEELCDIVSLRYNPDKVFDCQRIPAYPEKGQKFTAFSLRCPRCLQNMSEVEIEQCHLRLQFEDGDQIGLYVCKNDVAEEGDGYRAAVGDIYGLGDGGFLFVDNSTEYGYFFVNEIVEPQGEITYSPRTGKATIRQIISYRF